MLLKPCKMTDNDIVENPVKDQKKYDRFMGLLALTKELKEKGYLETYEYDDPNKPYDSHGITLTFEEDFVEGESLKIVSKMVDLLLDAGGYMSWLLENNLCFQFFDMYVDGNHKN